LAVLEPDETILTPVSTPRVTDDPITTLVRRVSGKLDSVINGGSALSSGKDTTGIVLPWLSITADGEGHALEGLVDGSLRSSDRGNGRDLQVCVRGATRRCALAVNGGVRVARFGIETTLVDNPLESFLRVSSVASIVIGVGVDDLLGRTGRDGSTSHQVGRLDGLGGGESPARTALFLVLDRGGLSLCDPIDGTTRSSSVDGTRRTGKRSRGAEAEERLEFFSGPVSELGVAESGGLGVLVLFYDLVRCEDEVAEARLAFERSCVGLVPELVELVEGLVQRKGRRKDQLPASVLGR